MAATQIIDRVDIDKGWQHITNFGENFGAYLIAIKGNKTENDVLNLDDLKNMVIEVGVDSGIKDAPAPIQRVNLKFNEYTGDGKINNLTAFSMVSKLPRADVFIRVVSFSDGYKEYHNGSMPISMNTVLII